MRAYTTVKQPAQAEFIEKRSRFIGRIQPITTEEDITGLLSTIRAEHRDARHHCYAYMLKNGAQRCSDDGEPQGTAGVPILEVLRRNSILDCVIVVSRYFGGTLLGAPGLVRAYSHTAKLALEAAGTVLMQPCALASFKVPYALYDRVGMILQNHGAVIMGSDFGEYVSLDIRMPSGLAQVISDEIAELTGGVVKPEITGEVFT